MANRVRLALFVLAYNLGNFLRRLALPKAVKDWSMWSAQGQSQHSGVVGESEAVVTTIVLEGAVRAGLSAHAYLARQMAPPQKFSGLRAGEPHRPASDGIGSVQF